VGSAFYPGHVAVQVADRLVPIQKGAAASFLQARMKRREGSGRGTCADGQTKSIATSITFSPSANQFAVLALPSRAVHIYNFLTAKLARTYDESLTAIMEMQQAGTAVYQLDDMDFGRRLALDRELERDESGPGGALRTANAVWDESGNFLLYPTMLGIKGVSRACVRLHGLYWNSADGSDQHGDEQGRPRAGQGGDAAILKLVPIPGRTGEKGFHDFGDGRLGQPLATGESDERPAPLLYSVQALQVLLVRQRGRVSLGVDICGSCTLTCREAKGGDRDVFNERPTREDQAVVVAAVENKAALATACTIHTSMGDIVSTTASVSIGPRLDSIFVLIASVSSCSRMLRQRL
jgi:peptidylprolyl isomerase domain and WD repeat-containing protein 1